MEIKKFYGQNNEDEILYKLFKDKETGFYIDVGALDGIKLSNTYIFDLLGWKGLCFEPHPRHFSNLRRKRSSKSICYNTALSNKKAEAVPFWAKGKGSTLNKTVKKPGSEVIYVNTTTLDEILEGYPEQIDFISIDAEGHEREILEGFNLKKHKPDIIVIEWKARKFEFNYDDILEPSGYTKIKTIGVNEFWCQNERLTYYEPKL